jgi:hypothetical protein
MQWAITTPLEERPTLLPECALAKKLFLYLYGTRRVFNLRQSLSPPSTVVERSKGMNRLLLLEHWGRGFEYHLSHACLCAFILCVGTGLATGWSPVQGVLPTVYRIKKLKKRPRSKGLYSHKERESTLTFLQCWTSEFIICLLPDCAPLIKVFVITGVQSLYEFYLVIMIVS